MGWLLLADDEGIRELEGSGISDRKMFAIGRWIGSEKNDQDEWIPRPMFAVEARWILNLAERDICMEEATGKIPTMGELVKFWNKHMYRIDQDDELAKAALQVGGVITKIDRPLPQVERSPTVEIITPASKPVDQPDLELEDLMPM